MICDVLKRIIETQEGITKMNGLHEAMEYEFNAQFDYAAEANVGMRDIISPDEQEIFEEAEREWLESLRA